MPIPITVHLNRHWVKLITKQHDALVKKEQFRDLEKALSVSPNRPFQDFKMPRKTKKRVSNKRTGVAGPQQPPVFAANSNVVSVYRFSATSALNAAVISVGDVLAALGSVVTVATTTAKPIFSSVKIQRIRIWAPATAAGDVLSEVLWNTGGENVRDDVKVGSTVGTANSGYYSTVPPKGSFSSMWFDSATTATVFFTLTCPVGSIIDIHAIGTLANGIAQPGAFPTATASAVVGTLQYPALDRFSAGTNVIVAVGRPFG